MKLGGNKTFKLSGVVLSAAILAACSGDDGANGTNAELSSVTAADVAKSNANMAYAVYSDSLNTAKALQSAVNTFVATPTQANMDAAKDAWLAAREPYGQSEVYRFRNGPIDDDLSTSEAEDGPEGQINAWPLAEALIDYVATGVDGDAGTGHSSITGNIIADTSGIATINKQVLIDNFEVGGEEANVTTGYHAIEFLLWGQDLNVGGSATGARDASAGQRPVSDYNVSGGCTTGATPAIVANETCQRRGDYLKAAAELLVDDLQGLVNQWSPNIAGNHYEDFVAGGDASVAAILESMGRLSFGELAGERMQIALLANSQEDEHSCFSDNTHRDIFLNAKGVQNSFSGKYTTVSGDVVEGAGIEALLRSQNQVALANTLRASLEDTMIKVGVIDQLAKGGQPFDQQIQAGTNQPNVIAAIRALGAQTDVIEDAIAALNLSTGDLRGDTDCEIGSNPSCPQ